MLSPWLTRPRTPDRRARHHGRVRPPLRLDALEQRSVPATFTVNTALDVVNAADGKLSLREAITRANTTPGPDVVVLPAGIFKIALAGAGEDGNTTGDFDLTEAVTIQGAGSALTVVNGQRLDRVFDVIGGAPHAFEVIIQKLAVRNGNVTGGGGGVQVNNADLTVRDCIVAANEASGFGGGISNTVAPGTGNVTLVRTTVARNSAYSGGGGISMSDAGSSLTLRDSAIRLNFTVFNGGGLLASNGSTANLTDTSVTANVANLGGGGIVAGTANLTGCTVSGNSASGIGGVSILGGGGIVADFANLTNCTVTGNFIAGFGDGGGILTYGTATLTNCTVRGNTAPQGAGGGMLATTANLTSCTISDNFARDGAGGVSAVTANVTRGTVTGNVALNGPGGGILAQTATLSKCTLSGNMALGGSGGGISAGTANLTGCTVSDNSSAGLGGGGIYAGTANLTNCTISGNTTRGYGGGIFVDISGNLLNCTIAENTAFGGGGVYLAPNPASPPILTVRNTIVALNLVYFGGNGPDVVGAPISSLGHNLIGAGGGGFSNGVNGDIVGTADDPIDPKLGALANHGGPTKTRALLAGSPAVDAGDNEDVLFTDQRGVTRVKDGNGNGVAVVDIGAFEK